MLWFMKFDEKVKFFFKFHESQQNECEVLKFDSFLKSLDLF